jgi:hypothetical protein
MEEESSPAAVEVTRMIYNALQRSGPMMPIPREKKR